MGCSDCIRMARQSVDTRLIHTSRASACDDGSREGMMNPRAVLIQAMLRPVTHILSSRRA